MPRGLMARMNRGLVACLVAGLLVVPASWLLIRARDVEHAAVQHATVLEQLGAVRAAMEAALAARMAFLRALCALASSQPDVSKA